MVETILLAVIGLVAIAAAVGVVAQRNVLYSGLLLVLNMVCLAGLYILANAQFVGVAQIIVYAGAVMVLFLFTVMMLAGKRTEALFGRFSWQNLLASVVVIALAIELAAALAAALPGTTSSGLPAGTAENVAHLLLPRCLWAFEATGLLLLVAVVGVVYLLRGGKPGKNR